MLVVAGGSAREIGPDGLYEYFNSAQLVEFQLCGYGVGKQEGEDVAADEFVVVDDLVGNLIIGQYSIGQILQNLGLCCQWFDGFFPQLRQSLYQFEYLQCHFIFLHAFLLVHFL